MPAIEPEAKGTGQTHLATQEYPQVSHTRPNWVIGTPRKLPKARDLEGRVAVLDVAFAGAQAQGFEKITLPFIRGLGDRLRVWVDHHDHDEHPRFADDPRFVLTSKQEHGACPELIEPALVERIGPIDTICCHNDFDGLASAAKWMLGGHEPYPGCDKDARAIDTRLGQPSPTAALLDRALRARPRDQTIYQLVIDALVSRLTDRSALERLGEAAAEMERIETVTRKLAEDYVRLGDNVVGIDITGRRELVDMTLLLLLGQEKERVALVVDRENVSVAAGFDSGLNFLTLFGVTGGMPTRISLGKSRLPHILRCLGLSEESARLMDRP